jgi:hypothetical protein
MAVYEDARRVPFPQGAVARLPIYPGFASEILPFLIAVWAVLILLYLLTRNAYFLAMLPWATVTILMLWPVGRRFGRAYFTYRTPLFVAGVLSMAYIIFTGFAMQSSWPYTTKLILFLLLPLDLTILGILPSLRAAIGHPIGMFFRPDLLFGDGRVLCCGTIAFVLGLRYFVGHPPPEGIPIPIPKWNWYAIFYAITLGFVPLIAIRGVLKLLLRLRRIRDDRWTGWSGPILRDLLLVATIVNIGFGFHNVFKGFTPFVTSETTLHTYSWVPLGGLILATLFLVFVRGGYKRRIGEPFIKETIQQTWVKELLYAAGVFVLMWSLMSILDTKPEDIEHAGYTAGPTILGQLPAEHAVMSVPAGAGEHTAQSVETRWPASGFILGGMRGIFLGPWNWVGLALLLWGFLVIVPFRVLAQHYQRQAIIAQMAAFIVPGFTEAQRRRVVAKMLNALIAMASAQRRTVLRAMNEGLAAAPEQNRAVMTQTMVTLLVSLPADQRDCIMEAQVAALSRLSERDRVIRLADMMGAVAHLPSEQRQMILHRMAAWLV